MFERSEFATDPAAREQRKEPRRGAVCGSPFFCLLFFGEAEKSEAGGRPNLGTKKSFLWLLSFGEAKESNSAYQAEAGIQNPTDVIKPC